MAQTPSLQDLLESGLHFGHQVKRWHPHMAPYIYGKRDNIHIIDLVKTRDQLEKAEQMVKDAAAEGKVILYVGTKRQAQSILTQEAQRAGMPYLAQRWIGGLITNWEQNKRNIDKLNNYDKEKKAGTLNRFTKKEQLLMERKMHKLRNELGGVQSLTKLPDMLFIIDPKKEMNAVLEANKAGIPTVALCDTNTNPDLVSMPIPGNDDSIKSLQLVIKTITDAIVAGKSAAEKGGKATKAAEVSESADGQDAVVVNEDDIIEEVVEAVEGIVEETEEQAVQQQPEKLEDRTLENSSKTDSEAAKTERKPRESKAEAKSERTEAKKEKAAATKKPAAKKTTKKNQE